MLKATAIVSSLLLGIASAAIAADAPQQVAQAQTQSRSQMEQDYQNRLRAAKTPEERARIQAEYDRFMQQGATPDAGTNVRTGPGTAGSGTMPDRPGAQPGESPTGGGLPEGQRGGGGGGSGGR